MNELLDEERARLNIKKACNYCDSITTLHPLSLWDKPEEIYYYCDQHIRIAQHFNTIRKIAFLEFYSIEEHRSSLPEPLFHLYNKWWNDIYEVKQEKTKQEIMQLERRVYRFEEKWQVIKAQKRLQRIQARKEREALQKEKTKTFFQKLFQKET
ncbi:MAG TPA: hypothetical protein VNM45_15040 [Bacillus sp. (in: firmicutes)]|nr:hypothetical protein [Bacillus sp. (in: firmicutes)]